MAQQNNVGIELKKFFSRIGYTQKMIAEKIGISQQVVGNLLNGRQFGRKSANRWSEEFGFNPNWLITGDGAMMLADSEKAKELEAEANQQQDLFCNTSKIEAFDAVTEIRDSIAQQILKLVADGTLYPKNVVEEKNEIIREKDDEIKRLNREIGVLQAQLEQAGIEPRIKKHVV